MGVLRRVREALRGSGQLVVQDAGDVTESDGGESRPRLLRAAPSSRNPDRRPGHWSGNRDRRGQSRGQRHRLFVRSAAWLGEEKYLEPKFAVSR